MRGKCQHIFREQDKAKASAARVRGPTAYSDDEISQDVGNCFVPHGVRLRRDTYNARWAAYWDRGMVSRSWGLRGYRRSLILALQVAWEHWSTITGIPCPVPGSWLGLQTKLIIASHYPPPPPLLRLRAVPCCAHYWFARPLPPPPFVPSLTVSASRVASLLHPLALLWRGKYHAFPRRNNRHVGVGTKAGPKRAHYGAPSEHVGVACFSHGETSKRARGGHVSPAARG